MIRRKENNRIQYLIIKKIDKLFISGNIENAEKVIKDTLKGRLRNRFVEAQLFYYLGEINYQKGLYKSAKRYFNLSLSRDPYNQHTLHELSNLLIEEYEIGGAKKYILRNLRRHPKNNEFNRQFAWCKMLLGQKEEAINIYRWLIKNRDSDPKNYVELSLSHLYTGDIRSARNTILNAYMRFAEDPLVEDTFNDINEIINSLYENLKNIYFRNLDQFVFLTASYVRALKYLVTSMTIRGYFDFEINSAIELLALFNKNKIIFKNYKLAALLSEYIISELTGEQMYIMKLLTSVNRISKSTIRRWYKKVREIAQKDIEIILDRLLDEYSKEFKSLFNKNE